MRLYYFYSAQDRPLLDAGELAAAAGPGPAGSGAEEGGAAAGCGVEAVPTELLEQLGRYRGIACLSYDFNTGWLGLAVTAAAAADSA